MKAKHKIKYCFITAYKGSYTLKITNLGIINHLIPNFFFVEINKNRILPNIINVHNRKS